ncbi:MAG: HAD family phosphatase [Bryobacterales bacterium]|nr:HAD family phosphatase [Bryobacterales bacterium]
MIKTLIFDLGGVIVPLDFPRAFQEISSFTPHSADEIRRRIAATDLYVRAELGRISAAEFMREMSCQLDLSTDETTFRRIWCSVFPPRTLIEDQWLEQLHERYRILMLSNTNVIHFEMIRDSYPILRHFDGFVLSYEVGHMKPAPEIYREAIRQAGCRPQECFFTDDTAANVEGALREGLDAVQFLSCEQLRAELAARGAHTA